MRINMPVNQNETILIDQYSLVSTTDLKGRITYANPYFIEVSGYAEEELIGKPHNILRHPDMPEMAFKDMWTTIKSGTPWTGLVKNRRKDGGFYWVVANVTPIVESGNAVGYMSVRSKPTREQIEEAAQLYQSINDGNPQKIQIIDGQGVKPSIAASFSRVLTWSMTLKTTLILGFILLSLMLLLGNAFMPQGAILKSISVGFGIVSLLLCLYFGYYLQKTIYIPLKNAVRAARIMAGGDLTFEVEVGRQDEMGKLLKAVYQLNVNLHSIIGDVRRNFEHIQVVTQDIATGNMDLSERTESQASALEETASSMEELSSTVKSNADHAIEANQLAHDTSEIAKKGGAIVGQVVSTIDEISQSSKKIVDIIGLIDSIAFQTNILALNAAVEAARAGEQGRGFAVVASEVRSLAQKSASAAKEIKVLIDTSNAKVQAGTVLAEKAQATMSEIIHSVEQVNTIMSEISVASKEQSDGIFQVNAAVAQMDDVTQQNAALVEEAAAAASSLEEQTQRSMQAFYVFKLKKQVASNAKNYAVKKQGSVEAQSIQSLQSSHRYQQRRALK